MNARVAVATARYGDPWDELSVLANRLAGALACAADVDILVPAEGLSSMEAGWDGACRLLRFPATGIDRRLRAAWRKVVLGEADRGPAVCACPVEAGVNLPALVQEQLVLAEGGDAPGLYEHLRGSAYDATVFVGLHSPATFFGLRALPDGRRALLVPGHHDAAFDAGAHDLSLERVARILVCTETEARRMAGRLGPGGADRVENLAFLVGVNTVVLPDGRGGDRFVVVARDWRTRESLGCYRLWAETLARSLPEGLSIRLVGPGAAFVPHGVPHTDARIDAWWWMSRAVAVIDPTSHRVVAQEVLEAMLLGVPVVVAADGDATREHAELGDGGLWYRANDELVASIRCLLQGDIGRSLGDQGRSYALSRHADTDTYVKRLVDVVLG